jgi:tetratricopeptide (TPR) repeat protein
VKLGPYEVLSEIGRGGMGAVYRARSPSGAEVAVKLLLQADEERLGRFDREKRLLESLGEDQGFVPLIDAGVAPAGHYLVMPFIRGGTLRAKLDRGKLTIEESLRLGRALAATVGRAHERGVVHRDLKPENVLFGADDRPLIADLGLAKHFRSDSVAGESRSLTVTGVFRGTPGYMAPEQMKDSKWVGPQADVFALGAIIYECLTGSPAFMGETPIQVLSRVDTSSLIPVRKLRPDTPRWLEKTIDRALSREPARRFANGTELGRALVAGPAPRHSPGPIIVVGLLVGVALGIGALVYTKLHGSEARALCADGDRLLRDHSFAEADAAYKRALALDPELALAWKGHAEACVNLERTNEAREAIARALALGPDLAESHRVNGWILNSANDNETALVEASRAIELDPRNAMAWGNRSHARAVLRNFQGARDDAKRALELDPKLSYAWLNLAAALEGLSDKDGRMAALDRAIEADPMDGTAWKTRGVARMLKGDNAGGLADMEKLVQVSPKDPTAYQNRAIAHDKLGDMESAMADLSRAIELNRELSSSWASRARLYLKVKNYRAAFEDANEAVRLNPRNERGYAYRGQAHEWLEEDALAVADYEKYVELAPNGEGAEDFKKRIETYKKTLK